MALAISRLTGNADATAVGANPGTTTQTTSPASSTPISSSPSAPTSSPVTSGLGTTATASASPSSVPSATSPTAPSTPAVPAGAAAAAGTISSTGTILLGTADSATTAQPAALPPFTGKAAVANAATVQSVPADEGFWVGTSPTNRIWVQLTGGGESPETVTPGAHVSFAGTVTTNPAGFAAQTGVDDTEGAGQLTTQGAHIAVAAEALKLSP